MLKVVTMNIPDVLCRWTTHRTPFPSVKLGPETKSKMLAARADGYLEVSGKSARIRALVEVKAVIRRRGTMPTVLWQEAAGIAA